jgi:anhydro-N-acetylmuramic acid kinase
MELAKLLRKRNLTVLGLNSGTSADGVDMAAVAVNRTGSGLIIRFLDGEKKKYPPGLCKLVLAMADGSHIRLDQIVYLDRMLGLFFGKTAAGFLKRLAAANIAVDMVASHGQTVRHLPEKIRILGFTVHGSLQLGSLEQIAERTNRVVVGDFRQADIALGNEGAPITVAAMARLFSHPTEPRLIVNIGGISNFFYLPGSRSTESIRAADCGPGNSLCDLLAQQLFRRKFDRNGRRALAGSASAPLVKKLLAAPFFRRGTTSTGRETFGSGITKQMVSAGQKMRLSKEDLLATAAEFTVAAITVKLQPILRRNKNLTKLYLTGGGTHNRFFRRRLSELHPDLEIGTVAQLGFDPDLVEAAAYAVMGEACLRSEKARTRFERTGPQRSMPVPGKIVQPPQRN